MRTGARGRRPEDAAPPIHVSRVTGHGFTRDELRDWGKSLGASLKRGDIIALEGELGAGKTTLAQAICNGVGVSEDVTSPTFSLVNQYEGKRGTVYHLDLYRLGGPADLTNLGWDDIVNSSAIVIVEWPDRAGSRLPDDVIRVRLEYIENDDNRRRVTLS